RIKDLTKMSIVIALYVVVTLLMSSLSFGPIQIRIAEMFNLLVIFDKKYIPAVSLAVLLVNFASPLGPIDVVIGTLETLLALITIYLITRKMKKLNHKLITGIIVSSLFMFIIALEIVFITDQQMPFWLIYLQLIVGEAISVSIGALIIKTINSRLKLEEII
ncbi:MAG: QueT transporter family protein, partial [Erysipelotrichales bacterium]